MSHRPQIAGLALSSALTKVQQVSSAVFRGLFVSAFMFCSLVEQNFEHYARPFAPDPAKGFTSLVHNKMGNFYGTPFEGLTIKYGLLCSASLILLGTLLSPEIRAGEKPAETGAERRCGLSAAFLLFAALLALWWSGF